MSAFSCLLLLLILNSAWATVPRSKGPTILVLTLDDCCTAVAWPGAENAIEKEFLQEGFQIVRKVVAVRYTDKDSDLIASLTKANNAVSAIQVTKTPTANIATVHLWVAVKGNTKFHHRLLTLRFTNEQESTVVAGLKSFEMFQDERERRYMMQDDQADALSQTPALQHLSSNHGRSPVNGGVTFGITAGVAGVFSTDGVPAQAAPIASLQFLLNHRFGVGAKGWTSVLGKNISTHGESASFSVSVISVSGAITVNNKGVAQPSLELLAGAARVKVSGENSSPTDRVEKMTSLYVGIGVNVAFVISSRCSIVSGADAALLVPRAVIHFKNERVASFGTPLLNPVIKLELLL